MNDRDPRGSGSTAAIIAIVVVILLVVPCLLGVVLFGAGIFVYQTTEQYETEVEQLINEPPPPAPAAPASAAQDKSE